jgi:hypothetical protein
VPLAALVIRPLESTVKFVSVYDPGVTAVATNVGLGYVPVRSPPAAPPGDVPDIVTFAAAVNCPCALTVNVGTSVLDP